jgi:hypothetical protein
VGRVAVHTAAADTDTHLPILPSTGIHPPAHTRAETAEIGRRRHGSGEDTGATEAVETEETCLLGDV